MNTHEISFYWTVFGSVMRLYISHYLEIFKLFNEKLLLYVDNFYC
jgi:hypothetical protein